MDYQDFLNCDQWALFRQVIFEHYDGRCFVCNAPAEQIHHLNYRHGLFNPRTVIPVCRPCHEIWRGRDPTHLSDQHPELWRYKEIARLARCLGLDRRFTSVRPQTPETDKS